MEKEKNNNTESENFVFAKQNEVDAVFLTLKKSKYFKKYLFLYKIRDLLTETPKDIVHFLLNKKPIWGDAEKCGRRFCRFCGGKYYK